MKGPLAYIGGKSRLAPAIIALFPKHHTYVEPFAGGAHVLFAKEPSKAEIINDLNFEVVNFFRICREHPEELQRHLRFTLRSRRHFDLLSRQEPELLTDIQRAARFFYLLRTAYGNKPTGQNFGYGIQHFPGLDPKKIAGLIEAAHERLSRVQIEAGPYQEVLSRYDRPETLFYLDPPYWGTKVYPQNFGEEDFRDLRRRLSRIRGKFVLSLGECPEVRAIFTGFYFRSISTQRFLKPGGKTAAQELLITNFTPKA
ncbi:MAG TPA: DNA adenine methylase [Acidobacteriota bacterium]|nr:DNA adenine methylase [Acidobacteriota bacterium]